jgi:hypothetical protein
LVSSKASINFFNDEAIKDEHINWKKKKKKKTWGVGIIDWYIQGALYHIYNVIIQNQLIKACQTTHNIQFWLDVL